MPTLLENVRSLAQLVARGLPDGFVGSIDATNRCNLRCKHCYFFAHDLAPELSLDGWRAKFEALKREGFPFFGATWVGGEPLVRRDLVELGMQYFRYNKVVTNGTFPLPDWRRVSFVISVDGTEEAHDRQRGAKVYGRIVENVEAQRGRGLNIALACSLTTINVDTVEPLLEEWWARRDLVRGVVFDFYTPVSGLDDDLWLDFERRDRAIARLLRLKRRYGDFVRMPASVLRAMRSVNMREFTAERCPLWRGKAFCFDPAGETREPCVLGPKADCSRCGCVIPYAMGRVERFDPESIVFLFRGGF